MNLHPSSCREKVLDTVRLRVFELALSLKSEDYRRSRYTYCQSRQEPVFHSYALSLYWVPTRNIFVCLRSLKDGIPTDNFEPS